ncbi:GNAT family N-acetyltransferase [Vibrio sp. MMG022]|uniref:GNAT family N-acetyltransferase n=1 Tax=Vibrio TaxID=662 RepID=UPI0003A5D88A|nr:MULTISPECIES: GNAT family protein [Vibrio]MCF6451148.1 GNAT family N-acetyltransferase [Vibrio sp. MMG023]CAH1609133.1 GNAT family N-acetyltransferase [Vibrio jasicida]
MRVEAQDVAIRYLEETDAAPLFENYLGDEQACLYLNRQAHQSSSQTLQAINRWRTQYELDVPSILVLAIEESATQVPIGCLVSIPENSHSEIHFGISRNYQGKGYATQACKLGIEYLKSVGVKQIHTAPHIDHQASIRVLEKCGFKKQGVLKEYAVFPALSPNPQDCLSMYLVMSAASVCN